MRRLADVDPDIAKALREEAERQHRNLELIASENFVSEAVLEAMGSVLTNKYAEGYPGRRYYGGCEVVDVAEELAIGRARELFGAEHANVQPHSGAQANMAVYFTILKPGDVVLGPNLSHGGHLTAGSPVNYSGKFYSIVAYGVRRDTELIDLDEVRDLAKKHRPMHVIAGKAVAFKEALTPEWRAYQQQIVRNANALAAALLAEGYRLITGGTDTHLMLLDVGARGLTGKDAQEALDRAWITVNKNTIPFETKSPMVTSGIRIGTPAVTTRGMKEPEMAQIAALIDQVLANLGATAIEARVRGEVQELTNRFPLYPERRS